MLEVRNWEVTWKTSPFSSGWTPSSSAQLHLPSSPAILGFLSSVLYHCSQDTLLSFPPSPFIGNSPPKSTFCRLNHLPHKCGHGQAQSCPALAKDTATVPITNSHFLKAFLPPKTCGSFTHMNCISISFFYFDNFLLIVRMWDLSN